MLTVELTTRGVIRLVWASDFMPLTTLIRLDPYVEDLKLISTAISEVFSDALPISTNHNCIPLLHKTDSLSFLVVHYKALLQTLRCLQETWLPTQQHLAQYMPAALSPYFLPSVISNDNS